MMRTIDEIQRAHDLFAGVLLGEAPMPADVDEADQLYWKHVTGVLCWVLQHNHNRAFARNMATLEQAIADAGYILKDTHNDQK